MNRNSTFVEAIKSQVENYRKRYIELLRMLSDIGCNYKSNEGVALSLIIG